MGLLRAAALFLRGNEPAQQYLQRQSSRYAKAKALSILAHKLARAVYHMLKQRRLFERERFMATL